MSNFSGSKVKIVVVFLLLLSVTIPTLLAVGCSSQAAQTISIKDDKFEPKEVKIKVGESVTWKNDGQRKHNIMSGTPENMTTDFTSGMLEKGQSWTHKFDKAGEYQCHDMEIMAIPPGKVIVQ